MNKKLKIQSSLMILLMAALSISAFPCLYANDGECPFEPGCGEGGEGVELGIYITSSRGLMGMYIVEGAGYVLDARAGVSTFMNRFETVELTGADFPGMRDILSRVIDDLKQAKAYYMFINFIAKITPYRGAVIERLKNFGYDDFQNRSRVYPKVFKRVKRFLKPGNVRGAFSEISKDIDSLLDQLHAMKASIDADQLPSVQSVWQLNQSFSEKIFFGQYFAMVMAQIK